MEIVYFLQVTHSGPIKIGTTKNWSRRFAAIRTSVCEEIRVLGFVPGGIEVEQSLHRLFVEQHIRGEWFRPDQSLLDYIQIHARSVLPSISNTETEDYYTLEARKWVADTISDLKLRQQIRWSAAKSLIADNAKVPQGLIENLLRSRTVAISAQDYFRLQEMRTKHLEDEMRFLNAELSRILSSYSSEPNEVAPPTRGCP